MEKNIIKVDVVSDVACPWCYIGKRRLEAAIKQWDGDPVEVNWHPFQLDPSMPLEGMDRNTYLTNKFGSVERFQDMMNNLIEAGKREGIKFDFGDNWLAVNTLPLHQLLHVARKEGLGSEMKEIFLKAYFEETQHLNRTETLYTITKTFGWDGKKVDAIINDQKIKDTVKTEISYFQQRGVSSVPFFVINDKYGISGAQPSEVFLDTFQSLSPEKVISEADSCDPMTGNC